MVSAYIPKHIPPPDQLSSTLHSSFNQHSISKKRDKLCNCEPPEFSLAGVCYLATRRSEGPRFTVQQKMDKSPETFPGTVESGESPMEQTTHRYIYIYWYMYTWGFPHCNSLGFPSLSKTQRPICDFWSREEFQKCRHHTDRSATLGSIPMIFLLTAAIISATRLAGLREAHFASCQQCVHMFPHMNTTYINVRIMLYILFGPGSIMNQNSPDICATVCILLELDMCNACWVSEDYTLIQMAFGSYGDLIGHLLWLSVPQGLQLPLGPGYSREDFRTADAWWRKCIGFMICVMVVDMM